MATYREIKGLEVPYLDADLPSASASTEAGSVWYNSTTGKLRAFVSYDTWASGADFITNDLERIAGFGTQTACVSAGGYDPASPAGARNYTYEYNGSGWSTNPNVVTTAGFGYWGTGTSTAGLIWGGNGDQDEANEFNGTSWTEGGNLNTSRTYGCGGGTQTAGLATGGTPPRTADSEEYNGSAWTEANNLNNARDSAAGTGTQTACLAIGGNPTPTGVEVYDGTSWTEVNNHPAPGAAGGAFGISTAALYYGGEGAGGTVAEAWLYDGSAWTASTDMPYASYAMASINSAPGGVSTGMTWAGSGAGNKNTIEFQNSILTFTPAAWATGGSLNLARSSLKGAGTQTAGLAFCGATPGGNRKGETEAYDGTSWTEVSDASSTRNEFAGFGQTQTAAMACCGTLPGGATANVESWNGTSWTEGPNQVNAIAGNSGAGTTASAVTWGGSPSVVDCESWDNSSWTEVANLNTGRVGTGGLGASNTSALAISGDPPGSPTANVESWNGTAWTEVGNVIDARVWGGASGTVTEGLFYGGGNDSGKSGTTQGWDGTVWSTDATMGTARYLIADTPGGTGSAALATGGFVSAVVDTVEEYTGVTTAAEASDIAFD
jgi:hypothetical protein